MHEATGKHANIYSAMNCSPCTGNSMHAHLQKIKSEGFQPGVALGCINKKKKKKLKMKLPYLHTTWPQSIKKKFVFLHIKPCNEDIYDHIQRPSTLS